MTKVCPACGAEYLVTSTICADCRVALVGGPAEPIEADVATAESEADGDGDGDGEVVAYDLADWRPEQRGQLVETLDAEGIPFAWEGDDLLVDLIDEQRVEELVEGIDYPDALPDDDDADDDDGSLDGDADAGQVMSDLFVAADRLRANPEHAGASSTALLSAEAAAALPVPYGFDAAVWNAIVLGAGALADRLRQASEPDEVAQAADALRTLLRPYV